MQGKGELTSWLSVCDGVTLCRLVCVPWEGCGIRLYRCPIIAFSSTLKQYYIVK